ncbi:MAG: phenylalanine--tRNA ligase subunit beta [Myxococcales bacterium]|nr:phenylalanine--tRNA ligase subunit beta [Myxococcales bacterium]
MLASHKWLEELTGLTLDVADVEARLTAAGIEVEGVTAMGEGLDGVVVGEVVSYRPHPERQKLRLVTVTDGSAEQEVVCGAPNVPEAGGRVLLAKLGAVLPGGFEIAERKLGGVVSRGMLCSETELQIGSDESGIVVLGDDIDAAPGTPAVAALDLHDTVYELGLTPNRPDCLGHVGIARELCALLGKPFTPPVPLSIPRVAPSGELLPQTESAFDLGLGSASSAHGADGLLPVRVEIDDPDRCPRYGAALVAGVTIGPSPFWLRYRLHVLGLRAISNVVDLTNLILLGWGHPIHAFDYDKVRGSMIRVRLAADGEAMHTLDGEERKLTADDLLICDGDGPVALAGVMGGGNSEIGDDTERVLIECAYFDPRSVRRTSKRTGLHTDSSHRFERGVDPNAVRQVLANAASAIAGLGGGTVVADALDVNPKPIAPETIEVRMARVEALLGTGYEPSLAERVLRGLGCDVQATKAGFGVTVPTHRPDIGREVDLIEELARVRGYDAIPTELPQIRPSEQGTPELIRFTRRLREAAARAGLTESVNYAFLATSDLKAAGVSERTVRIVNPLSEERSVMRTALLPGLSQNLQCAQRQQVKTFAHFELARVFSPRAGEQLPDEPHELGLLLWGDRAEWYGEGDELDFYDAKAALERTVHGLCGGRIETRLDDRLQADAPQLHPKRRARVWLDGHEIGVLGELHPETVERLDLLGRPIYGLIAVPALLEAVRAGGATQAHELPRFPAVTRDIAVEVDEALQAGEVAEALREAGGERAEQVKLFDVYRGDQVAAGHKSLAFRVTYRDRQETLTDKVVDKLHARVQKAAEQRFGASVRR